jgi:hypothetical protein
MGKKPYPRSCEPLRCVAIIVVDTSAENIASLHLTLSRSLMR